jgi:hypothetical protein
MASGAPPPSGSASASGVQAPATNVQTFRVDLGLDALRQQSSDQREYIQQKKEAINAREQDIKTRYGNTLLVKNLRDAALIESKLEEQRTYLSDNTNTSQKNIETWFDKSNNSLDVIIKGLIIRTALIQIVDIFQTTVKTQGTIQTYPLTDNDKKNLLTAAEQLMTYYNNNPTKTKQEYLTKIASTLSIIQTHSPVFEKYIETLLLSSPEYIEIINAVKAKKGGTVLQSTDILLGDRLKNSIASTFVRAFTIGLALWGGTLAANDAIWRNRGYRVVNFIYGSVFFFVTLPYYIYRYFKNSSPTLFALLPLTTYQPQTMMEKIIYGLFWYIPNKTYEQNLMCRWNNELVKEAGAEPTGEDCDAPSASTAPTAPAATAPAATAPAAEAKNNHSSEPNASHRA